MGEPEAEASMGHVTCRTCPDEGTAFSPKVGGLLPVEFY